MYRTIYFVDGFNLYHAITQHKALKKYRWLNLQKLCSLFLSSKEKLAGIFFFTAFYPGNPLRLQRHKTYLRALELHDVKIILGEFKKKHKFCQNCKKTFIGYEEKQTDVNIAIELFRQAVQGHYDNAAIISGDSDLIPAIQAVKSTFPEKNVKIILPPGRKSESLKQEAHHHMRMKERHLATSQLPETIVRDGFILHKPVTWT